ncbi:hypothetical protein FGIG_10076 [Fasciola gigantica]|uniref:Uncharacterized protein n=1 Tax=Fasciola gigantica TaxID=46835 RepID=A0A504Z6E8_FASGI|nr:hypothetical protein FGIG_10076 [Fasciola gigantica]
MSWLLAIHHLVPPNTEVSKRRPTKMPYVSKMAGPQVCCVKPTNTPILQLGTNTTLQQRQLSITAICPIYANKWQGNFLIIS